MKRRIIFARASLGSVIATTMALSCGSQAFAQATSSDAQPAGAEGVSSSADFGEIVVTAQRREQKLKEIPMSVSAISGADLEKGRIQGIQDIALTTPSIAVQEFGSGKREIIIRGIGGLRGTSSLTGVYLDDTPLSGPQDGFIPGALDVPTYDLERVEILKGPQGTLFGEGATGGVVRYNSKDPNLSRIDGNASISAFATTDGDPSVQAQAAISLPIMEDKLGVRIAGTYERNGGWIDNVGTGKNDANYGRMGDVRAKVLFTPTPELEIRAMVEVHRNRGGATNIVNVLPFDQSKFVSAVFPDAPTKFRDNFEIYNLTATYDFGFATLLSSTSHSKSRSLNNLSQVVAPTPNEYVNQPLVSSDPLLQVLIPAYTSRQKMTSQEVRLSSNGAGAFKWIVGGMYKASTLDRLWNEGYSQSTGPVFNGTFPDPWQTKPDSKSWAVFADGSYLFFDRLEIGGGIRRFHDKLSVFSRVGDVGETGRGTFNKTTYRGFAKFNLSDEVNVYANVGTGFRSGGFNSLANVQRGAPESYGPENATFYELGLKSSILGGGITFNLAAFQGHFRDQFQDISIVRPDGILQYTINGGSTKIRGIEWLLAVKPERGLTLSFSGDVTSAKWTKVTNGSGLVVGDPVDNVPDYNLQFSGNYDFDWSPELPGSLNVSYSRRGPATSGSVKSAPSLFTPAFFNPALNFLQASVSVEVQGFEVSLFAKNLLDEREPLSPSYSGLLTQARPRNGGIIIRKSF